MLRMGDRRLEKEEYEEILVSSSHKLKCQAIQYIINRSSHIGIAHIKTPVQFFIAIGANYHKRSGLKITQVYAFAVL